MKNWSIKKRVLMLALFPMLLVALSLATYFNIIRINDIESSLLDKGQLLANQLAPACEYGVFTGNIDILDSLVTNILQEEDVIQVTISNASNETLISRGTSKHQIQSHSIATFFVTEEKRQFNADIIPTEIDINDFDELMEADAVNKTTASNKIGTVSISMTTMPTRIQQLDSLLKGFLITLAGLVITVFLAIRISHGVVDPIQRLTHAVKLIARGELHTRINIESGGEIGSLVEGVNSMAEEIQIVRENLEIQIGKATAKLKKTLDELEIQNIELDLARNNALSASRIKSEFLANMSHEIRTPMNGVLGFTDLLYKTKLSTQQKDLVDTIRTSASNLLTIINDILDFSKIESGKLEIERLEFNLTELMDDIISMFAPMAYKKNLELIYHTYVGMPERMIGDPSRIRQILVNLIGNAIKFTVQGHVIIRIIPMEEAGKKINLKFTVTDTGIGMDEQNKKRLFTAFTQADTSISRKFGGTGLGLVISRKLTELMHGDIGFESAPNKGSTFWFSIELEKSRYVSRDVMPQTSATVLVYEPMSLHRLGIRNALHRTGAQIIETGRLDKIDSLIKKHTDIKAILAGVSRPDIHNDHLLRNLAKRLNDSGLPYLVLISSFDNNDIDLLEKQGIHTLLFRCSRQNIIMHNISSLLKLESKPDDVPVAGADEQNEHHDWHDMKVLVVDDNEINIKLSHSLLQDRGISVTTASNGEQALQLCRDQVFDLLLMDLHMPKMDGFMATRAIRKMDGYCRTVPVIALTANILPDEQKRALETGMNDILVKPITETHLFDCLLKWTGKKSGLIHATKPPMDQRTGSTYPVFDEADAIERAGGNKKLAMELMAMLHKELPDHLGKINAAMQANKLPELKQHTHKLHGATSYCGVPMLRHAARQLETVIDNKQLDELESSYAALLAALEALEDYYSGNKLGHRN